MKLQYKKLIIFLSISLTISSISSLNLSATQLNQEQWQKAEKLLENISPESIYPLLYSEDQIKKLQELVTENTIKQEDFNFIVNNKSLPPSRYKTPLTREQVNTAKEILPDIIFPKLQKNLTMEKLYELLRLGEIFPNEYTAIKSEIIPIQPKVILKSIERKHKGRQLREEIELKRARELLKKTERGGKALEYIEKDPYEVPLIEMVEKCYILNKTYLKIMFPEDENVGFVITARNEGREIAPKLPKESLEQFLIPEYKPSKSSK